MAEKSSKHICKLKSKSTYIYTHRDRQCTLSPVENMQ